MRQTTTSKKAQEYLTKRNIEARFEINARNIYVLSHGQLDYKKLYNELREGDEFINAAKLCVRLNLSIDEAFDLTSYFFQQYPDLNENWVREISYWAWFDFLGLEADIHMQ